MLQKKITQFGLASSFLLGLYDDEFTFEQLAEQGDFGHGTFNAIDGEMIAIEGVFYRADVNGDISTVEPNRKTPIATVTHFKPDHVFQLENINSYTQFQHQCIHQFCKKNRPYAIRIDALFELVSARSESAQKKPYESIKTSIPKAQHSFSFVQTTGSLVGYYIPDVYQSMIIAGFHFHYINDTRTKGGHVFDFKCDTATVSIQYCTKLDVLLPLSSQFDEMNLNQEIADELRIAEHGK